MLELPLKDRRSDVAPPRTRLSFWRTLNSGNNVPSPQCSKIPILPSHLLRTSAHNLPTLRFPYLRPWPSSPFTLCPFTNSQFPPLDIATDQNLTPSYVSQSVHQERSCCHGGPSASGGTFHEFFLPFSDLPLHSPFTKDPYQARLVKIGPPHPRPAPSSS